MEESSGDIDDLARQLFVRGSSRLFFLTLDGPDAASEGTLTLANFCTDLLARGSLRLHATRDPTLLSPAQFAELAACMLRAGFEIELALAQDADDDPDTFFVSALGGGGTFRARVRVTRPRARAL